MAVALKSVTLLLQSDDNIFATTLDDNGFNGNEKEYLTFDGGPLNRDLVPSWSLDGSKIVYTNLKPSDPPASGGLLLTTGHIWTMNADGSDQTQLTSGPIEGTLPSFSPDGTSILFTGYATGTPELWLMNTDGSDPHPITHTTGSGVAEDGVEVQWSSHGSFSPDGTKIAYSSTESGRSEIWVMNSDGSEQRQLTFPDDPSAPDANNPTWSPDGGKIVFFGGFERIGGNIFTMNPDGSDRTQLTHMPSDDPSWSPDGQQIFFDADRADNSGADAWIMNRDGSHQRLLSSMPVAPSRIPAITKVKAVTVPNDLNSAPSTGFDLQDISLPGSATVPSDNFARGSNNTSPAESSDAALAVGLESSLFYNDNGDSSGCEDGCW